LWWENTSKIGWETAYIVPEPRYVDEGPEFEVMVGADLGFPATAPRGTGNPDAGLLLTQALPYVVTAEEEGEDLSITSFTPVHPMPWDEEGMHVARRDHVVLYGAGDEADFIDSHVDQAE